MPTTLEPEARKKYLKPKEEVVVDRLFGFRVSMKIIHSNQDETNLKYYRCQSKATNSNRRFQDQISKTDVLNCLKRFNFKCAYCANPIKPKNWQLDHFHPRANGGKNVIQNICPCCKWCNTLKNALDGWAFLHRCKLISQSNAFELIGEVPPNYRDNPVWAKGSG